MTPLLIWLALAVVFAGVVAGTAYWFGLLNRSGALAAFLLGFLVFGFGGISWTVVLLTFFLSSSLLSKAFGGKKGKLDEKYAKGSTRDAGQVIANGGVAGLMVILHVLFPDSHLPWVGYCAAFAAANADTWATELGVLSKSSPRLVSTWQPVPMGTSGGVTVIGSLSAVAGALLITIISLFFPGTRYLNWLPFSLVVLAAGALGSLVDSWLGATLQAIYWCQSCGKETEQNPLHRCGSTTTRVRGVPWMNNDWVNVLCTLSASAVGILLVILF